MHPPSNRHVDFFTALQTKSERHVCTKQIYPDGETAKSQSIGAYFKYTTLTLRGLADLQTVLMDLACDQRRLAIRGTLRADLDPQLFHPRQLANVIDEPHHWLCLDFDEVEAPDGVEPTDPQAVVWLIRHKLPKAFHRAAFVLQWSSSAGTAKAGRKIKSHLWFWLETARTSAELRQWAKSVGADAALFNAVQPHFTAAPVFVQRDQIGIDEVAGAPLSGPRILFVHEGLSPTVSFSPPPVGRNGRSATSASPPPRSITKGNGDKATDGREAILRDCVWSAACELRREGSPISATSISGQAWEIFSTKADISDGKWNQEHCFAKSETLARRIAEGQVPNFPAEIAGTKPHWSLNTMPTEVVRAEIDREIESFCQGVDVDRLTAIRVPPGRPRPAGQSLSSVLPVMASPRCAVPWCGGTGRSPCRS